MRSISSIRKVPAAFAASAIGAVNTWNRIPASDGPPISATDSVAASFELPSTSRSRSISEGR